ncbi:conserved hypothetical protein [uncultured Desulfobacterium sp.]|uniref:Uncharacterized protein n=1 Tax=uncultured Desulfobacterium sp. TaxID=201089 RepID=A0A445MRR4_9BACT|nr:conserved hypothetical protein [uncultured Desulfobacterium sp.]
MPPYHFPEKFLISLYVWLLLLLFFCIPCTDAANGLDWQTVETKYTIIHYRTQEELEKFSDKIRYRIEGPVLKGFLFFRGSEDLATTVVKKVDALFEKAQQILDMRKNIKRVTINIHHDKEQLHQAYQDIYNKPCPVRAWYEYAHTTIYININDMHEGMLAHEMAHHIIDNYFLVRPPSATSEILARYVDSHLKK